MSGTETTGSRLFTVRLSGQIRDRLDNLAKSSDRTLAQLARYALTNYFQSQHALPISLTLQAEDVNEVPGTRHTSLRLPSELSAQVEEHANNLQATSSDIIRHALILWLEETDASVLGAPTAKVGAK